MRAILSITCLVLLGLLVWQHQQDERDRKELLLYVFGRNMSPSYEPCYKTKPKKLKNHDDEGGWNSVLPKPGEKLQ